MTIDQQYPNLTKTVRYAWRVAVAVHMLNVFRCVAWVCAGFFLMCFVLQWVYGSELLSWAVGLGCVMVLVGVVWVIWKCPTRIDAAGRVDIQYHLSDLISSAWAVRLDDSIMSKQVLVMAEYACGRLPAGAYDALPWRGQMIAVMTLSVLIIGNILTKPSFSDTLAENNLSSQVDANAIVSNPSTLVTITDSAKPIQREADSDTTAPMDRTNTSNQDSAQADPTQDKLSTGGTERSNGHGRAEMLRAYAENNVNHISESRSTDKSSAGNGLANNAGNGNAPASGSITSVNHQVVAPWNDPLWKLHKADALNQIHAGIIPDNYRDMVQAYFQR